MRPADKARRARIPSDAVTPQQVSDAARQHLQDDQATIVVVGDRKVIEEQVKAFGKIVP